MFKPKERSKYFTVGYNSFLKNTRRDLGDDLPVEHRKDFRSGWDEASILAWDVLFGLKISDNKPAHKVSPRE